MYRNVSTTTTSSNMDRTVLPLSFREISRARLGIRRRYSLWLFQTMYRCGMHRGHGVSCAAQYGSFMHGIPVTHDSSGRNRALERAVMPLDIRTRTMIQPLQVPVPASLSNHLEHRVTVPSRLSWNSQLTIRKQTARDGQWFRVRRRHPPKRKTEAHNNP